MPNIKSAKKRNRTSLLKRDASRAVKSRVGVVRTKLVEAIDAGDKAQAEKQYSSYCSVLDRAVKKHVIAANAAARHKSRLVKKIAGLSQA